ncbi:hypothetical protein Tco_0091004 [Tanacetum coccineum]
MGSSYHHMFVTWEKVPEIRRSRVKNYKMKYDDDGPSLTVNRALICEELSREELEKDLSERILILNEPRPIIETLKYGDRYKKVLDTITLDKLKLDGELELEEEEADEEMIREYKAIKEKKDPELGTEYVKPVSHNVSMLNHSEAEPIGMLKDVLCQIGVTMVLAKFLILDMPVDRTIPIIVGRSFLHTCGGIINTLKGTTSTFDGVCHQKFYVVEIQNKGEEIDSDDKEEYYLKRDEMGRPFYGPNLISYFDRNDHMELALAIQDSINLFRKIYVWKKAVAFLGSLPVPLLHTDWMPKGSGDFVKEVGNEKWQTKIRVINQYGNTFEQRFLGCYSNKIYSLLKRGDAYDELRTKKIIKFKLGGSGCTLTLLEFARRLELYHANEINDEGFEVYFQGGLRSDENFNARDYWLSISSEEELHLSRSLAFTIRRPILRVLQKMITYGDLYDRMGNLEIRQGKLERMAHSQSYQLDRHAELFEHMAGHYRYTMQGAYAPPGYDEEQQDDEEWCRDDTVGFCDRLKIKKRTGNARKSVKYDNGCLKKDLEENLRRILMKNSQVRRTSKEVRRTYERGEKIYY